jgi:hypothetical protein
LRGLDTIHDGHLIIHDDKVEVAWHEGHCEQALEP